MLDYGWKRLCSGLLALTLVAGMLPPVTVTAEETEDAEVVEILESEPAITEPVETEPVVTEPVETTAVTEAVTEPVETTAATGETEATEETVPETTAEIVKETTAATEETVAETTEVTEATLPENVAAVQALIDALPDVDSVTEDDYDAVQAAFDAYEVLTEEEKALIQGAEKFEGLFGWFNAQVTALGIVFKGKCGTGVSWILTDDGTLTISGTGDMKNYSSSSSAPWYSNRSSITMVVIEDGVTSIGSYAFYDCSKLTSITIPESITIPDSVTSIGGWAFDACSGLTDVYYGGTVERWLQISVGSSNGCLSDAVIHGMGNDGNIHAYIGVGTCGDAVIWSLTDDDLLTISGTGEMKDYSDARYVPW